MSTTWNAKWIGPAFDPREDLGVFAYRCRLRLEAIPASVPVRVSADNRYKLWVNGEFVAFGPQRGDLQHWFYESLDLAPFLRPGENDIYALVWNFGWLSPMAQHSARTAFVMEAAGVRPSLLPDESFEPDPDSPLAPLSTPGAWEVARVSGWSFRMMHSSVGDFYIDVGPGEIVDFARLADESATEYHPPHVIAQAEERGASGGGTQWMLVPRSIPEMRYELRQARPLARRGFAGDPGGPMGDGVQVQTVQILPGQALLLDYGELLTAYPRVTLRGPAGGKVGFTYAESLWEGSGKGNRDSVAGKEMRGYQDLVALSGGTDRFEPLWWRTYRFLMLVAEGPGPVEATIEAVETGYPLAVESSFDCDDPRVGPIWEASVRTAQRCAGETYFDCPYYEQLQYVGDTRIQALIGYYLGRDRSLTRNAVETLGWSRMENGLTQSRYPSRQTQVIPPFSLWWVMMRHDQRMYDRLEEIPEEEEVDVQGLDVANAYSRLSGESPDRAFWNFADWVPRWRAGEPPSGPQSTVHLLTLYHAHLATELALEREGPGSERRRTALREFFLRQFELQDGLVRHPRDPRWEPSEHSEALHRLLLSRLGIDPSPWPQEALRRANAAACTYYFSYYKHLAMRPEDYLAQLDPWTEMIESGLSTFAENPEPTRSDCHAWSAHPILGLFQIVAGVTSAAQGWRKARVMPRPGSLRRFDARIAHPDGELRVAFENGRLEVDSPVEIELIWQSRKDKLAPGRHAI